MRLRNIAVDFDYTLVRGDKPIPGAKEAMQSLKDNGYVIYIHSCNNRQWIERILNTHEIPYDYIWDSAHDIGKPICDWYVDDRAIGFRGDWKAVLEEIYGEDARAKALSE
jgi:hypothetical protein